MEYVGAKRRAYSVLKSKKAKSAAIGSIAASRAVWDASSISAPEGAGENNLVFIALVEP